MQPSITDIISAIASTLLLIVTVVSVICAINAYHHQKNRAKKDAACELAYIYAKEVIPKNAWISNVFEQSGQMEITKKAFPIDRIENFTYDEMSKLAKEAHMDASVIEKGMIDIDPICLVNMLAFETKDIAERRMLFEEYTKYDEEAKKKVAKNPVFLQIQFADAVTELMNTLEWFAMNCRYGLADEAIIFQSLHQTYLSIVWSLYWYISNNNKKQESKYYTNLIWLFKEWRSRLEEQTESVEENRRAFEQEIAKAEERMENVGREYAGKALR